LRQFSFGSNLKLYFLWDGGTINDHVAWNTTAKHRARFLARHEHDLTRWWRAQVSPPHNCRSCLDRTPGLWAGTTRLGLLGWPDSGSAYPPPPLGHHSDTTQRLASPAQPLPLHSVLVVNFWAIFYNYKCCSALFSLSRISNKSEFYLERVLMRQYCT